MRKLLGNGPSPIFWCLAVILVCTLNYCLRVNYLCCIASFQNHDVLDIFKGSNLQQSQIYLKKIFSNHRSTSRKYNTSIYDHACISIYMLTIQMWLHHCHLPLLLTQTFVRLDSKSLNIRQCLISNFPQMSQNLCYTLSFETSFNEEKCKMGKDRDFES